MAATVYILCMAASSLCALMLWRAYRQSKVRLLFWSALCFGGLAVNNLLLVVDRLVLPNVDLFWVRSFAAVFGIAAMIFGFVWDAE
jgi:hypothetical protein